MTPIPDEDDLQIMQNSQQMNTQNAFPGPESPPREPEEPLVPRPESELKEYNDIEVEATLEELKIAQQFISALQEASLDTDNNLDATARINLQDPIREPFDIDADPHLRAGLDFFLDTTNASDETYHKIRDSTYTYLKNLGLVDIEKNPIPSLFEIKKAVGHITGVHSMMNDQCINTCIAYTGPFTDRDTCLYCNEPRYDLELLAASDGNKKVPRRQFYTIPIGPLLQAFYRNPEGALDMLHRANEIKKILEELETNGNTPRHWEDVYWGSDHMERVKSGEIKDDDILLMLSIDGAQLYQSKQSDCWIYIWVIFNLAPNKRYKKHFVFPGGFISGPNKPKNVDSYVFPGLHHLCALMKDGLKIWDINRDEIFISHPFLFLGAADGPGMTYLNGLTGHSGAQGCRLFCPVRGRRKDRANHYYPALLKPDNYDIAGCNHPDINPWNLGIGNKSEYLESLQFLLSSQTQAQYQNVRRETGVSKPSIFSGLPANRTLGVPNCSGGDLMHLVALNITDLLLGLWRGSIDCDTKNGDDRGSWDWAVLTGDVWKEHGVRVAEATPYLPDSFDRPPRNPAEKISSGYKAWEFLTYVYGLGLGLFYEILPRPYWKNFCKLVRGVRLLHQRSITTEQLIEGHQLLVQFCLDFEELYYKRKVSRLHFCRQSLHALLHIGPEITRIGPGAYSSQWTMERMIGILGQEIRQPSNPFQNLSERGLRRARINALQNIIPDLVKPTHSPRISVDLGNGFILIGPQDPEPRMVHANFIPAFHAYFTSLGINFNPDWVPCLRRWARIKLPNEQFVRTAWKEKSRAGNVRSSRHIMVRLSITSFEF